MLIARSQPNFSVVIPAHNEAESLPGLIAEIDAVAQANSLELEIIVIDDSSSDATPSVLSQLSARYPNLATYRLAWQSGQSAALAAGFDLARAPIIITMDADGQNDPADIPKLIRALEGTDVAIGWRRDRKDPLSKKVISKVANFVRNAMTGESVKDTGCGLKAFRRESLERIHRFDGMHRFLPTLVKMHGYRVAEVAVHHRHRTKGKTHYNLLNRSIRPIMDLFAIRWLQQRTLRYQVRQEVARVAA